MQWARGEKAPWLSALGMLGGGFGMAMVATFLLLSRWAFWETGTFQLYHKACGADYRIRTDHRFCHLVLPGKSRPKGGIMSILRSEGPSNELLLEFSADIELQVVY